MDLGSEISVIPTHPSVPVRLTASRVLQRQINGEGTTVSPDQLIEFFNTKPDAQFRVILDSVITKKFNYLSFKLPNVVNLLW